jgi:uncharacterized protein YggT (Ycf19 family)
VTFHPAQSLWFLVSTILSLVALFMLLRAAADAARMSYAHPLMRVLLRWTPPRHAPQTRFGGRRRIFNPYAWFSAWVVFLVEATLRSFVLGTAWPGVPLLLLGAFFGTIDLALLLYAFILIVYVLAGWIVLPPELASTSSVLASPLLAPLRRYFPGRQGVDFAPLVAILVIVALLILLPGS